MTAEQPESRPRRELIVEKAAHLFATRGFAGASLRDLAKACGIRQPSLYNHFPSKEAILVEVVNRYFDALLPELRRAGAIDGDGAERLIAMIETCVHVDTTNRDVFLATSNNWEHVRNSSTLQELLDRRDEALEVWRRVLKAGREDGSIRDVDPYHALWIIASAMTGMADLRYAASDEEAPPIDALVSILVDGLRAPKDP